MDRAKADKLAKLVKDEAAVRRVFEGIVRTVEASFVVDHDRAQRAGQRFTAFTEDEIRRRSNVCYDWFMVLRGDLKYGTEHAIDTLALALRADIDGIDFVPPPADRSWTVPVLR